jgi:hypothetical protein
MDHPNPMRDLARRLSIASASASEPGGDAAAAIERLGVVLSRVAGTDDFSSLLRRALRRAAAEVPALEGVKVSPHGRVEGLATSGSGQQDGAEAAEAGVAIITHLLVLLATFIGEPLTLRMVYEAWPDLSPTPLDGRNSRKADQ